MIRVFNLYVPSSKLVLVIGDALLLATGCFLLLGPLASTDTLADAQLFVFVLLAAMIGIWSFYFSDLYENATLRSDQHIATTQINAPIPSSAFALPGVSGP